MTNLLNFVQCTGFGLAAALTSTLANLFMRIIAAFCHFYFPLYSYLIFVVDPGRIAEFTSSSTSE
jgi:hypothetical protein